MIVQSVGGGGGGCVGVVVVVRGRGRMDAIVDLLADEVDAESDEGDAEARSRVPELLYQHRMLPPLVSPPEELSRRSQRLVRHRQTLISDFLFLSQDPNARFLSPSLFTFHFLGHYPKLLYYPSLVLSKKPFFFPFTFTSFYNLYIYYIFLFFSVKIIVEASILGVLNSVTQTTQPILVGLKKISIWVRVEKYFGLGCIIFF